MSHQVGEGDSSAIRAARNETLSHVLYAQEGVGDEKKDSSIIDVMIDQFKDENIGNIIPNQAIASIGPERIKQIVLGPNHIGILLHDGNVCRIPYHIMQIQSGEVKEAETVRSDPLRMRCEEYHAARAAGAEVEVIPLSGGLSSLRAATGNAKYRRVMLSNRAYYRLRGNLGEARGYILGSSRNVVPASNVPEDLINNVQQVLQGKSREVIIRELQRTGLNVNEAVNNLLSRDDGDDGADIGGEHLIPEELLQMLEGGASGAPGSSLAESFLERVSEERLLDSIASRAELRYQFATGKKPKAAEKDKKKKETETTLKNCIQLSPNVEWWCGETGEGIPQHALEDTAIQPEENKKSPVVSITATTFQMYVLHKNGKMYTWDWQFPRGNLDPVTVCKTATEGDDSWNIGTTEDPIVEMSSSNLRIAVLTRSGYMVTWFDEVGAGIRLATASETVAKIPEESVVRVEDLVTSDHLAAFRIDSIVHWCGVIPLSESARNSEKDKSDKEKKKHVSFGEAIESQTGQSSSLTSSAEFEIGQQVQMKKAPLYPAGSVAAHIDSSTPFIGVLLEDCWKASDHCRFRSLTPEEYDYELEVIGFNTESNTPAESVASTNDSTPRESMVSESRKRSHDDTKGSEKPDFGRKSVEVWLAEDLIWIHEHRKRDIMTVHTVDNNLVAVKALPNSNKKSPYQSVYSDRLDLDSLPQSYEPIASHADSGKLRLMRKDDLQAVDKGSARTPVVLQKELLHFDVDSNRTVVSMVADLNELRVLARSKHHERGMHMYRVNTNGKVISRRRVPVYLPAVERKIAGALSPKLITFGDARTLFLRDSTGQLIPLQRDALNGFREPPSMHSQPILHIATAWRPTLNVLASCEKKSQWQGCMLIVPGVNRPWHSRYIKDGSSLMQLVLYCDSDGVSAFLDRLHEWRMCGNISHHEFRQIMNEQLFAINSDLCSNVLHAAIRLSIATKNVDDMDKALPDANHPLPFPTMNIATPPPLVSPTQDVPMEEDSNPTPTPDDQPCSSSSAPPGDAEEESRWGRVLRSRPKRGTAMPTRKPKRSIDKPARTDSEEPDDNSGENASFLSNRSDETGMPFGSPRPPEARQKSALTIVDTLLKHPAMFYDTYAAESTDYLEEQDRLSTIKQLLLSRDLSGMTPFQAAINQRAYGAAHSVWRALLQLKFTSMTDEQKMAYIFPGFSSDDSHNADDSPLFILCYNDVCSFTWTGEDHINQDIYECKTCGLTGSLCCCSECALTCHRNHDCRLKRTSPTAYCDCWEKSNCKALIAGNEILREFLLNELLTFTRLYQYPNARNEHIILFLSRTVIRQTREQNFSQKRRHRYRNAVPQAPSSSTPEHNLHPPKFAKNALEHCCKNQAVVLDAIEFGLVKTGPNTWVTPGQLDFLQQGSAAHLDKLAFALSNKVMREYSTAFVLTLRQILSNSTHDPQIDENVEFWVSRFVRSLVRVLTLAINVSPLAPSAILSANDAAEPKDPREERLRYNITGTSSSYQVFSALITTKKDNNKLSEKSASFVAMINRVMEFLQQLPTFAVVQLAVAADAIFEPVRDGMLKPMVNPAHAGNNSDPMDILEKYFASDLSFSEILKKSKKEERSAATVKADAKRSRKEVQNSRRDTDRDAASDNRESMEDERASAGDRASESQETARVRTDSTATSTVPTPRRRRLLSGNTTNDTNEDNEERTGQAAQELVLESSSDEDDDDNEEDDDDNEEDDDDDDDEDDDSDRPAEDRQEADNRDDGEDDDQDDADDAAVAPEAIVDGAADADGDDDVEDDAAPAEAVREEDVDWPPYVPGSPSPRAADDDNSSDSQDGPDRDPQPFAMRRTFEAAARASQAIATANAPTIAARERAIAEYESVAGRRPMSRVPPGVARITQYYSPYRVPQRGGSNSGRRDDSSSGGPAASSSGGSSSQPATTAASSSAPAVSTANSRANTAAPSTSTAPANQDTSPTSNSSKKGSDTAETPTLETAREQLALTFSILVRAGCDILSRMPRPVLSVYTKADDNAKRSQLKAQRIFGDILEETFRWMGRVFESTESKIKFNEAYEKSLVRPISPSTEDKRGRKEAMNYLHSLLRLATDEAKDSLAFVEVEMLYPVALVADAYFHFLNCNVEKPIELKQIVDFYEDCRRRKFREQCEETDPDLLVGFFVRPISLSWPGYIHDGAWDTISGRYHLGRPLKIEEECPMIGGPKILTMKSKPEEMFRETRLDDGKRKMSAYLNDPVEEYTFHIQDRPFEYRKPGASMSMVPHRKTLEQEFISITRDFYHHNRTPDEEVRDYSTDAKCFPGYVGRVDDAVSVFKQKLLHHSCNQEKLLFSKWFKTLNTIGVHFYDKLAEALGVEVAFENSILLRRLASFETKHKLFNKATEKYRTHHSNVKEIVLDVRREPNSLFRDTMIQLHNLYQKRMLGIREHGHTPLAGTRLRVHFIDEPGEGTGVTRSFYTAFAESCMMKNAAFTPETAAEKSSLLQSVLHPNNDYEHDVEVNKTIRKARREQAIRLRTQIHRLKTFPLNLAAPRFDIKNFTGEGNWTKNVLQDSSAESQPVAPLNWGQHEITLRKIHNMTYEFVNDDKIIGRVMGIMCQLPTEVFVKAVNNDDTMRLHIQQILSELRAEGEFDEAFYGLKNRSMPPEPPRKEEEQWNVVAGTENINAPLFETTPHGEYWIPNIGNEAPMRIAAFRTVGRIMGICLSQGDIFPMRFARHVFAYILKQPICWLDLSFYDPQLFNNLRMLICSDFKESGYEGDFTIMEKSANGSNVTVLLKPKGDTIIVNQENVLEYVYKYAERTLVGKRIAAFDAMREGILDVIPESMLDGLYPEDLRLILCGIESVSISVLQENTAFLDESRALSETLTRFKQWFWQVIESFTPQEKQDLVFFWTGSPSLPAAGKWQTAASVMLRPQEDMFLPTANTCISRIYVPVYSSKRILRSKLLMAIKAKNFGFV